ncbi:MAG: hypothetical protein ABSG96_26710 [Terracidiphilus sp.]|jgi:hypothetical protein
MTRKSDTQLTEAMRKKMLVKFWSPFEPGSAYGYVLDIGPRFFLLGLIGDEVRFNGFQCMRLADVRQLRVPDPNATFIVAALRKRGEVIEKKPKINLNGVPQLLKSAQRLFPLVTIHQERVDPDSCKIGRVVGFSDSDVYLLEIGPDAIWEEQPTGIPLREITRVDFGGGYEDALYIVGGDPDLSKLKQQK